MTKLPDLKEQRAMKVAELRALATKEVAGEDLGENEQRRFDTLESEVRAIDARINRVEAIDEMERRAAGRQIVGPGDARDLAHYSVARAIRGSLTGALDGLEGEVHAELSQGRETRGVMIPTEIFLGGEKRDGQIIGDGPSGGYLMPTITGSVADRRRPALKVQALGATVMSGLVGNVELPNLSSSGTAYWVGENQGPTRSSAQFEMITLSPRTVSAEYKISRRLMLQSNESVENIIRNDGGQLLAQALDSAAIKGTGAPTQPGGVLESDGTVLVANGASFVATTADLISALETDDVTGTKAFLTNPHVLNVARKLVDGEGRLFGVSTAFHEQRVEVSTQVPANIGVSNNKSALIYGEWASLVIGYWSAVDVLVNPYHSDVASSGGALIHFFLDADVAVRHDEAFVYAEIA